MSSNLKKYYCYIEGSSTPINRKDMLGNTYQSRKLKNGAVIIVIHHFIGINRDN